LKKYMILSALIVFLITGLSLGQEEDNASSLDETMIAEDIAAAGNDSEIVDEAVSENVTVEDEAAIEPAVEEAAIEATPNLNYIWAVYGIEDDRITMVLNQEGEDLYGQAKYEPEGADSWNAVVVGSIIGDKVDLVITALKGDELVSSKLSGIFADEALSGSFFQVIQGQISNRGEFNAEWIDPDTSSYTPAVTMKPEPEPAPEVAAPAATEQTQQPVQLGRSFTDVRQFADQIGPGGDLSGIPPGMSGIL
jgi:hypothetical protein